MKHSVLLPLFVLALVSCHTAASDIDGISPSSESYAATVLSVYDGDTFTARVELGLGVSVTEKFRLNGLDCPELNTAHGKQVRDDVRAKMINQLVMLKITKRDKYGRWLADVFINGENLRDWLLFTGSAKPYNGIGAKPF